MVFDEKIDGQEIIETRKKYLAEQQEEEDLGNGNGIETGTHDYGDEDRASEEEDEELSGDEYN